MLPRTGGRRIFVEVGDLPKGESATVSSPTLKNRREELSALQKKKKTRGKERSLRRKG